VIHINILCISPGFYFFPFEKEAICLSIFTTTDKNIKQPCENNIRKTLCILPHLEILGLPNNKTCQESLVNTA